MVFTAGSAASALAPGIGALIAARAVQGVGAAIVTPLTATGGLGSPGQFSTGLTAALTVSAAILAASALVILLAPETRPARQARQPAAAGAALAVPGQRRGVTDLPA